MGSLIFRTLVLSFSTIILSGIGCGTGADIVVNNGVCEGYVDESTSPYVLPYLAGESYKVSQGNCNGITHYGLLRYSYDFDMNSGATIIAIRAGKVHKVFKDGETTCLGNFVMIDHGDGSYARYLHLSSTSVTEGDTVDQGDVLGQSGSTGCTGGFAHLHLDLSSKKEADFPETIPINFSNTTSSTRGLQTGKTYLAE